MINKMCRPVTICCINPVHPVNPVNYAASGSRLRLNFRRGSTRITNVTNAKRFNHFAPGNARRGAPFLMQVYKSSRGEDLRELGWDEARIDEFLGMQYEAQRAFEDQDSPRG